MRPDRKRKALDYLDALAVLMPPAYELLTRLHSENTALRARLAAAERPEGEA